MDNILPLASRRCPDNIDTFLESSDVQRLFGYYSDSLEGVFSFYATSDKRSQTALLAQAVKLGHVTGPFAASQTLTVSGRSPSRATRGANTMKDVRATPRCTCRFCLPACCAAPTTAPPPPAVSRAAGHGLPRVPQVCDRL